MTVITESTPLGVAATPAEGPGRLSVKIINPGWGSSGYYSPDVLEAAAKERVFPAGTHMYVNHPSATEAYDRPERDLNTLAAVLATDAVWDGTALVGEAVVFSNWRTPIAEMAEHIGVSIRGSAEVENGEAEGRKGTIITRLTEGASVDFVTKAGRGGSYSVLESALATQGHRVGEASASDTRDAIQGALRERYVQGDDVYLWLRDYDPDEGIAWFETEGDSSPWLRGQRFTLAADGTITLDGEAFEVTVQTTYVPVDPAGQSTNTQESEEDTMPQIEEARLRQLEADASRATVLETEKSEAVKRAEQAEEALAEARKSANASVAQRVVNEAFTAAGVTAPKTVARLADNAPLNESGAVDEDALKTIAEESAAELSEATGAGTPRGMGGTGDIHNLDGDKDLSEADLDRELAALNGREIKEG